MKSTVVCCFPDILDQKFLSGTVVTSIILHNPSFWMVERMGCASLKEKTGQLLMEVMKVPWRRRQDAFNEEAMQDALELGDMSLMKVR